MKAYFELGLVALLPSLTAGLFTLIDRKTRLGNLKYYQKQIIVGIVFGLLAVLGTEFGIPMNGAQVNCRDAAVLSAGLFFGAPSGVIAGLIGGAERWVAVAWGVGTFTRVACTVSTILAGILAGLVRKFMLENKKPGALLSLAMGAVMEVIHLSMVFFTNMKTPEEAITVVEQCSAPMIIANAVSVFFSGFAVEVAAARWKGRTKRKARVSQTIQRGLLIAVALAFVATTSFVFVLQNAMTVNQRDALLSMATEEIAADISDASDANLLRVAKTVKPLLGTRSLKDIADEFGLAEISVVNEKGIIAESTDKRYVGFDMSSGRQSSEFLCLLNGKESYVQDYGSITSNRSISRKYAAVKTDTGFVQVGYNAAKLQSEAENQVAGITKNRHIGETGCVLLLDGKLNVVSAPADFGLKNLARTDERIELPEPDVTFRMTVNGDPCFCRYRMAEGYYIVALYPEEEALQARNVALFTNAYMQVIVYAALFVLIYTLIKKVVVNQIKRINKSLAKITGGDLEEVVDVRSNEEFESLSDDINSTVDTLKAYIAEASARIDKELEFAKNIQKSALPSNFSVINQHPKVEIFAAMDPAKEVGGDFYDFYYTSRNKLHFLIADVSGKGIPAAMFMMRAKTELKSLTEVSLPINEVFTQGNESLCEGNEAGMFVTAWQGGIDLETGLVQFANAGHNPPLVRRNNGKFEYLKSRSGFVLAGMEGIRYKAQELQLEPGDEIFLYTDGVTEATNASEELYGEDRLCEALNSRDFDSMQALCEFVKADVDAFVGDAPQFDDITMVALRYGDMTAETENK